MYEFSKEIWENKYREGNESYEGTMLRVAKACAKIEKDKARRNVLFRKFSDTLLSNKFYPAGRILYTFGTKRYGTSMNCFVIKGPDDSMKDIFRAVEEAAVVTKAGGGVGFNISKLRPNKTPLSGGGHACFPGYTKVLTNLGLIPIRDIKPNIHKAVVNGKEYNISQLHRNGRKCIKVVKFRDGRMVNMTDDHQLIVLQNDGTVSKMCMKDVINNSHVVPIFSVSTKIKIRKGKRYHKITGTSNRPFKPGTFESTLDENMAYILGIIAGDGSVKCSKRRSTISITCNYNDTIIIDKIMQSLNNIGISHTKNDTPTLGRTDIFIWNSVMVDILNKYGLLKYGSETCDIPTLIYTSDATVRAAFICGLIDSDGTCTAEKRIQIKTTSRRLAFGTQELIGSLGILSTVREHLSQKRVKMVEYKVEIPSQRFKAIAKALLSDSVKVQSLQLHNNGKNKYGTYPFNMLKIAVKDPKIRSRLSRYIMPYNSRVTGYKSAVKLRDELLRLGRKEEALKIEKWLELCPIGISSVTDIGVEDVFDITVDNLHQYIVNGIIVSNSGPVSFLRIFNASASTILIGSRRSANIAILNADHPDIFDWIDAKRDEGEFDQFNLSLGITEEYADALKKDADWNLTFNGKVYKTINSRDLFDKFCESAWKYNDPGIFHIGNVNKYGPGNYIEKIESPNPCGEMPLLENTACCLGALNLVAFVKDPFTSHATLDYKEIEEAIEVGVEFLDNVLDITTYPLPEMKPKVAETRRIGLGVMGLADALSMLKIRYGSDECIKIIDKIWKKIRFRAYMTSATLGKEKGSFPKFDKNKHFENKYFDSFSREELHAIMKIGTLRNVTVLTCAPCGTTALIAGNVSSGIEPIFSKSYRRKVRDNSKGTTYIRSIEDYAWRKYVAEGKPDGEDPEYIAEAHDIPWQEHVAVQERIQLYVGNSISKTINMPGDITLKDYKDLMFQVITDSRLKGITTYVARGDRDSILSKDGEPQERPQLFPSTLKRPVECRGITYKIPYAPNTSLYVTINGNEEIKKKLFEVFIECKDGKGKPWDAVTSRILSALFRRLPDSELEFIIAELKEIKDADSGIRFGETYVHSPSHAVAIAMEMYLGKRQNDGTKASTDLPDDIQPMGECPSCHEHGIVTASGCDTCTFCGYNKCEG